jgi:hypothetical protein
MKLFAIGSLTFVGFCVTDHAAQAGQPGYKVRSDQQRARMKNYAGPTCNVQGFVKVAYAAAIGSPP